MSPTVCISPMLAYIASINNENVCLWQGPMTDAVYKYLPDSTVTAKGGMKKAMKDLQSMYPKPPKEQNKQKHPQMIWKQNSTLPRVPHNES